MKLSKFLDWFDTECAHPHNNEMLPSEATRYGAESSTCTALKLGFGCSFVAVFAKIVCTL